MAGQKPRRGSDAGSERRQRRATGQCACEIPDLGPATPTGWLQSTTKAGPVLFPLSPGRGAGSAAAAALASGRSRPPAVEIERGFAGPGATDTGRLNRAFNREDGRPGRTRTCDNAVMSGAF